MPRCGLRAWDRGLRPPPWPAAWRRALESVAGCPRGWGEFAQCCAALGLPLDGSTRVESRRCATAVVLRRERLSSTNVPHGGCEPNLGRPAGKEGLEKRALRDARRALLKVATVTRVQFV